MFERSMMTTLAGVFVGAAALAALRAPVAEAQSATPPPMWTLAINPGHPSDAWRLNTRTGEVDLCMVGVIPGHLGWECFKMPEPSPA